jgi:hypothetical protein
VRGGTRRRTNGACACRGGQQYNQCYAGVATVSEVMMEHRRVDELRDKVKYMLQKEVSLAKAISDAQGMADTFEHTKNEIGGIKYMASITALYFVRKVLFLYPLVGLYLFYYIFYIFYYFLYFLLFFIILLFYFYLFSKKRRFLRKFRTIFRIFKNKWKVFGGSMNVSVCHSVCCCFLGNPKGCQNFSRDH